MLSRNTLAQKNKISNYYAAAGNTADVSMLETTRFVARPMQAGEAELYETGGKLPSKVVRLSGLRNGSRLRLATETATCQFCSNGKVWVTENRGSN